MVAYRVHFATFQAQALDLLHNTLKRMWRAEEDKRDESEGELSASSLKISSDEA